MAVYKRGYRRYDGPLADRWTRLLAFPRFAWRRLFGRPVGLAVMTSTPNAANNWFDAHGHGGGDPSG